MNVHVLWVHYQLKATGRYYQGDNWDETGNLGDTTMEEIAKFMKANGYPGHNGRVDQDVIDTLAAYLGSRRVPVYAGGFYEKMNTIMTGGSVMAPSTISRISLKALPAIHIKSSSMFIVFPPCPTGIAPRRVSCPHWFRIRLTAFSARPAALTMKRLSPFRTPSQF